MKCEYGFCLVCEKPLVELCPTCNAKRRTADYTEVEVNLSNNTRMKLAVCLGCKDKVHLQDKEAIMEAVREGWKKEQIRDKWSKEKMENYQEHFGRLTIV